MTWLLDVESWEEADYNLWPLFDRSGPNSTRLYMLVLYGLARSNGWRTVVELGGFKGNTTAVLAQAVRANGGGFVHVFESDPECATALTARFAHDATVCIHLARSQDLMPHMPTPLDLLFVDGEHTFNGCRGDIKRWAPLIARGGCMAFHDAALPAIQQAIAATLPPTFSERILFPGDTGLLLARRTD